MIAAVGGRPAAPDAGAPAVIDPRSLMRWGQRAARSGRLRVAHRVFVLILELDPANEEAWLWRAGTSEDPQEALRCLQRLLQLNPENQRAQRGLAEVRQRLASEDSREAEAPPPATEPAAPEPRRERSTWSFLPFAPSVLLMLVFLALPFQQPRSAGWSAEDQSAVLVARAAARLSGPVWEWTPGPTGGVVAQADATIAGEQPASRQPAGSMVIAATSESPASDPPMGDQAPPSGGEALAQQPSADEQCCAANTSPRLAGMARPVGAETPGETPEAAEPDVTLVSELAWPKPESPAGQASAAGGFEPFWVAVHRTTGLWSKPGDGAQLFRMEQPGARFLVARPQKGSRLYVWDPTTANYAYVNALDIGPGTSPLQEPPAPPAQQPWMAVQRQTGLWSGPGEGARLFGLLSPGAQLQVARAQEGGRLYVWDPDTKNYAYVNATDLGPSKPPSRPKPEQVAPPKEPEPEPDAPPSHAFWSGTARVTMYTCVELGGCNRTASGIWPYEGVVAVDRRVIPLGSMVWIEGLGTFLAADTGSAIFGNRIDVYVHDYARAIRWGVRYLQAAAFHAR